MLPRSRREDGQLRDWMSTSTPGVHRGRAPAGQARTATPTRSGAVAPAPFCSSEGYRIVWVHSSVKAPARRDRPPPAHPAHPRRADRAQRAPRRPARPDHHQGRRRGRRPRDPRHRRRRGLRHVHRSPRRPKSASARRSAAAPATTPATARSTKTRFQVTAQVDADAVRRDAATDGCFPLISNDHELTDQRGPDRLPLPAQPREAPPPAQDRPGRRAGHAEEPGPHRSAVRLPVHRAAVLLPDRTRAPPRDDAPSRSPTCRSTPRTAPAPHRPRSAFSTTFAPCSATTYPQRRSPCRPSSPAHTAASTAPGPARRARHRLHQQPLTRHRYAHAGDGYDPGEVRKGRSRDTSIGLIERAEADEERPKRSGTPASDVQAGPCPRDGPVGREGIAPTGRSEWVGPDLLALLHLLGGYVRTRRCPVHPVVRRVGARNSTHFL